MITLSETITLNISIIVLASPNKASLGFHHIGDHIINESMLIPYLLFLELLAVGRIVYFFKGILESTVVFL